MSRAMHLIPFAGSHRTACGLEITEAIVRQVTLNRRRVTCRACRDVASRKDEVIGMSAPRFGVGDHVRALVLGDDRIGLCGTVASAFTHGGGWVYGVLYDDHTPHERRPFGEPGHSYLERDLELVPDLRPRTPQEIVGIDRIAALLNLPADEVADYYEGRGASRLVVRE